MSSQRNHRAIVAALLLTLASGRASAQSVGEPAPSGDLEQARALYLVGLQQVREAHWAEALAAFERSRALRPHALTSYNTGACERALGHYTRAHAALARALEQGQESSELPASVQTEAHAFIDEIERILVRVEVHLQPTDVAIAVDGRPLQRSAGAGRPRYVAGTASPGPGAPVFVSQLEIVADPGAHVITLSRHGYSDIVVNKTFRPGERVTERWALTELPATIRISSNERRALVSVNGRDVGVAPVDVQRPAGTYRVEVTKPGFVHYSADVRVMAGEESVLRSTLVREKPSILSKWWFWTAATALASGVATVSFLAARGESRGERPALDGGSLGWVAKVP